MRRSSARPRPCDGLVLVEGELWRGRAEGSAIAAGERVVVTWREGLRLQVRKV